MDDLLPELIDSIDDLPATARLGISVIGISQARFRTLSFLQDKRMKRVKQGSRSHSTYPHISRSSGVEEDNNARWKCSDQSSRALPIHRATRLLAEVCTVVMERLAFLQQTGHYNEFLTSFESYRKLADALLQYMKVCKECPRHQLPTTLSHNPMRNCFIPARSLHRLHRIECSHRSIQMRTHSTIIPARTTRQAHLATTTTVEPLSQMHRHPKIDAFQWSKRRI